MTTAGRPPEDSVLVAHRGRVAHVTLNRPETRNAFDQPMLDAFSAAMARCRDDDSVNVVVLSGAGPTFCAGSDLEWVADQYLDENNDLIAHRNRQATSQFMLDFFRQLWEFPKPIVLQVQGHCTGLGCLFVAFCDLVVASDDMLIGVPEILSFALDPCFVTWPSTIGPRWTKALLLTGDMIDGPTAERIGMINKSVPRAELEGYVEWLSQRVARVDLETLVLNKAAANTLEEVNGLYAKLKTGLLFDHLAHMQGSMETLLRKVRTDGPREAIKHLGRPARYGPEHTGDDPSA